MSSNGECFIILPPNCVKNTLIFGRNSKDSQSVGKAQEVVYYDSSSVLDGESDGGVKPDLVEDSLRIILQKPEPLTWGGDCGANERNVSLAVSCSSGEPSKGSGKLLSTDIVRYVLATAVNANLAIEKIKHLLEQHGDDTAKFNFIVCDATEAWKVSCSGKSVECEQLTGSSQHRISATEEATAISDWIGPEPIGDGSYNLISMFETLRAASNAEEARSATVFVLSSSKTSCYWFTATPNAKESVFKPFVFAPNAKISPLTQIVGDGTTTLLHKLHAQRKPEAVENLKTLEKSCVEEVTKYLDESTEDNDEFGELMKDCVEAEVKFYR